MKLAQLFEVNEPMDGEKLPSRLLDEVEDITIAVLKKHGWDMDYEYDEDEIGAEPPDQIFRFEMYESGQNLYMEIMWRPRKDVGVLYDGDDEAVKAKLQKRATAQYEADHKKGMAALHEIFEKIAAKRKELYLKAIEVGNKEIDLSKPIKMEDIPEKTTSLKFIRGASS